MSVLENGFLLKLNVEQFKVLFPKRKSTFSSFNENNELVIDSIKIPEDVILCDYGCNQNMIDHDYFYLLMINQLCQGTVCKKCYEKYYKEENLPIIDYNAIFKLKQE